MKSQGVSIEITFDPPNQKHGYKTALIEIFSDITLQLCTKTLEFCSPCENWSQSIPNVIFSLEAEKISGFLLTKDRFQITLENGRLSARLNDPRFPEALHIYYGNEVDAFILW